jgi:hypothetical protein
LDSRSTSSLFSRDVMELVALEESAELLYIEAI